MKKNKHKPIEQSAAFRLVTPLASDILDALLPLLPAFNRSVSFTSHSAGDSISEILRISWNSAITLRVNIVGLYVAWNVDFNENNLPSSADDDISRMILYGNIPDAISAVLHRHLPLPEPSS